MGAHPAPLRLDRLTHGAVAGITAVTDGDRHLSDTTGPPPTWGTGPFVRAARAAWRVGQLTPNVATIGRWSEL